MTNNSLLGINSALANRFLKHRATKQVLADPEFTTALHQLQRPQPAQGIV